METSTAVLALSSLAHETRLEVFRSLARICPSGRPAGELARQLDVPAPTLSFHLAHLAKAGLVEAQREGRIVRYALRAAAVREFFAYLSEDCCQGRPELCQGLPASADACSDEEGPCR